MKLQLAIIILICCFSMSFGQTRKDSLLMIWNDKSVTDTVRLSALNKICSSEYLDAHPDSVFYFAELAYKFSSRKNLNKEMANALSLMGHASKKLEQQIREKQLCIQKERFALFGGLILVIFSLGFYLKKKQKQIETEHKNLIDKIENLKDKLATQSVSIAEKRKELSLDKKKLEEAINSKIGESAWMILNLIFENPSISNKEIAKEVSLSLEGVSSSLRRMYSSFNIQSASNKKISLMMKAVRISIEG